VPILASIVIDDGSGNDGLTVNRGNPFTGAGGVSVSRPVGPWPFGVCCSTWRRLSILVADLQEHLGLAQSTVSAYLACLRDCGMETSRPHGRASMFSLATGPELMAVVAGGGAVACRDR
jgi:DNA-binding transcriptional ArsR family regulator